jgi:hypothetical protein
MKKNLKLVLNKDENDSQNDDYSDIIIEILDLFESVIKLPPPLGIKPLVVAYSDHPQCLIDHLPDHYLIVVNRSSVIKDWCKFAYEFSHELCHIYCDPRVNNWFVESLCDLASIYFLERLGIIWTEKGLDFGPAFLSYKKDYIDKQLNSERLKGYNDDFDWLKHEIKALQTSSDREINSAIALKLFPSFKADSTYWKILPFLSKSTDVEIEGYTNLYDKTTLDVEKFGQELELNNIKLDLTLIYDLWKVDSMEESKTHD